jgi:diguanylate cyclase (GGDEF)-like protein
MGHRLLVVDDDRSFRDLIGCAFAAIGWQVSEVSKLAEARRFLAAQHVDLMILDGMLPDGSGIDFIEELREQGDERTIVFISAFWRDAKTFNQLGEPIEIPDFDTPDDGTQALSEVERALLEVKESFARALPERLASLGDAITRARSQPENADALREAHRLAHNLKGTAGSYGFAQAADAGAYAETQLGELIDGKIEHDDEPWDDLEYAVREALTGVAEDSPPDARCWGPAASHVARILIVSEDPAYARELSEAARRHMVRVHVASSGVEAVGALDAHLFDSILIDADRTGRQNPLELVAAIRARSARAPIALLAADGSAKARGDATAAGISLFLPKPVQEDALLNCVRPLAESKNVDQPRVLVVDDDEQFIDSVVHTLEANCMHVSALTRPHEVMDALECIKPDAMLLEVVLPKLGGFDICKLLRDSAEWKELPVLFVSALANRNTRLACFESGGDDYIEEPILPEELLARLRVRLARARDHRAGRLRDTVTGLLVRDAFLDQVTQRVESASSFGEEVAFCVVSLDNAEGISQEYGLRAADRVLAALGQLARVSFRATDVLGRWGGGELAVALYGDGAEVARSVIERLLDAFRKLELCGDHGEPFHATLSAGIAAYPESGGTLEELAAAAARKLAEAHAAGPGQVAL